MSKKLNKNVLNAYSVWSKTYDQEKNPAIIAEGNLAVNLLKVSTADKVLDLGCGTGRNIAKLLNKSKNIKGIDLCNDMLIIARNKYPFINFKQADVSKKIPYDDGTFSKILCSLVISHIKDINILFSELNRILMKNGSIVITTIHPGVNFKGYKFNKGDRFELMKYKINFQHPIEDIKNTLEINNLHLDKEIIVPITSKLRKYYTLESYRKIYGTPFLLILKIDKI